MRRACKSYPCILRRYPREGNEKDYVSGRKWKVQQPIVGRMIIGDTDLDGCNAGHSEFSIHGRDERNEPTGAIPRSRDP